MRSRISKRYMRSFGALYGGEKESAQLEMQLEKRGNAATAEASLCRAALNERSEDVEQIIAVRELKKMGVPLHHSPNGGRRDIAEAAKFKRMGVSAGFPDIFVPKMRKGFGGLFIELKREKGGTLSAAQKEWRDLLIAQGYAWHLAHGHKECLDIVIAYLQD